MSGFSDEQVEHMRQLFRYCDKDGSGSIDKEELGSVMHELGKDLTPEELTTLMNQLDVDGNGDVDFDEFLEGMGQWFLSPSDNKPADSENDYGLSEEELEAARKIFDAVDQDGSGMIDCDELKLALSQSGKEPTDDEVKGLMKRLNVVGDEIDFETFCRGFRAFMGAGDGENEGKTTSYDEGQINQYREIFKLFDRDGSGTIDIQEMRAVLNELGKKVDNKELEHLMKELDNDGSGEIDFEEFLKGMEKLDQLTSAPAVFQSSDEGDHKKGETISKLQEDVKELKKQNRAWQTKCQVYENEVNYYTNINQQQQDELSEKTRELERLRKDYKSSHNLKEINKDLSLEVDTLRQELKKARDAQEKLKRQAKASSQSMDKEKEDFANQKLASKEAEIEKLKTQLKTLNKTYTQLEEDLERLRQHGDQLEADNAKLKLQTAALLGLQDAHHLLQAQHEEYVALLDEARAKIFVLEGRLEEYESMQPQSPAPGPTSTSDSASSLANEMQAGSHAAEAEVKALRQEAALLRDEKQSKEKELTEVRLELATLRRTSDVAIASLKSDINTLKSEKAALEQEVQSLRNFRVAAEGEGLAKDKVNEQLRAENTSLKEKIIELEEIIRKLEEEIRSLRDAKEEDSKLNQELLEKNKKLSSELNDLNDIVSSAARASSQEPLDQEDQIFIQFTNFILKDDIQIAQLLPIGNREVDVSSAFVDGVILCKLINKAVAGTIDERVLKLRPKNKTDVVQNHNLCFNSAMAIGCNVPPNMSQNLLEGNVPAIMTFVSEIVKIGLLSCVSLTYCRELVQLKEENESGKQFLNLLPEVLLLRWVNYHLKRSTGVAPITNLSLSIRDGIIYAHLIHQLFPTILPNPTQEMDANKRIAQVTECLQKLLSEGNSPAAIFLPAEMISSGHGKMNLLGIASLFKSKPGFAAIEASKSKVMDEISVEFSSEGTREERAFKFWMQSLGIHVRNLVDDVQDGLVILQVLDKISPKLVDWKSVNTNRAKMNAFNKVENCNYAVKLGKELKFSMVGVAGKDFVDGNKKLILALVWQTMRHHIFSILKQLKFGGKDVTEEDMISWANSKVASMGKTTCMKDFRDKALSDSRFLIDLLYALDPSGVDYELVTAGDTDENKMLNAKYAINVARKLGCCVFLLPEDIVEVKSKLLLTFVGTLMSVDK